MTSELILLMQDQEIRKAFGLRLKELRKQKGWTQKELARQVDIRFAQLNKYECGMHIPPIERLIQLSTALGITLDYLVMGNEENIQPLHNRRLMERLKELEQFDHEDQETIIKMIDAMIVKRRVEGAISPIDNPGS
ncbi:helix-turn-helix domain-containing protein [Microbulbifer sp. 2304DJ12-6]|uniref:helix-turn-helix domain-containing protein n=1 Tax=Microbulbifer sp. 2304DJ12-6 TaxID=3233340 RepID=UPI0039B0BAAF